MFLECAVVLERKGSVIDLETKALSNDVLEV